MLKEISFKGLGIAPRSFFAVFLLVSNTFTWYYLSLMVIEKALGAFKLANAEVLVIWVIYYATVIGFSIIGSCIPKIRKLYFLYLWMALGTISSLLLIVPNIPMHIWCSILGASFGLGIPLCLAYFADHLTTENRGRVSGIIFLTTYLSVLPFAFLFSVFDLIWSFLIIAIWRGCGLILFMLLKPSEPIIIESKKDGSFTKILRDRSFIFYFVPWLMFILVDRFETPVLWSVYEPYFLNIAGVVVPIIGSFSAFFGGFLSDWIGRKRVVISGFVALGLAYAVLGINPTLAISWYLYIIVDGVAWGTLLTIFLLTLWGDLSQPGTREKYYVIGNIPLYLASILQMLLTSYIVLIPLYAAFSLAGFFLFLAVLPLMYAPETLPEKKIRLRQLRGYVEKAKKLREKYLK